jgi:hypothetical protein
VVVAVVDAEVVLEYYAARRHSRQAESRWARRRLPSAVSRPVRSDTLERMLAPSRRRSGPARKISQTPWYRRQRPPLAPTCRVPRRRRHCHHCPLFEYLDQQCQPKRVVRDARWEVGGQGPQSRAAQIQHPNRWHHRCCYCCCPYYYTYYPPWNTILSQWQRADSPQCHTFWVHSDRGRVQTATTTVIYLRMKRE